jgi:hypothetical protein
MADTGRSLITAFDYVWERLTARLGGLTDEEYPVPVTTIAWRLGHLGRMAVGGFASRLFGDGTRTTARISFAPGADAVPGFLDGHYRAWRAGMAGLSPDGWTAPLGPSWGPYAEASTVDLALHVLDEVVHHGAEVGLLRDLFAHRAALGG